MGRLETLCVYCGSSNGADPIFEAAARSLGGTLAAKGIGLVYGGGGRGLMGTLARAVLDGGGHVTGIIPDFLLGYVLPDLSERIVVPDMHTRKRLMFERADAFVTLPGGIGTLEEVVEQLTMFRLRQHAKPVLVADIGGFWQPLLELLAFMERQGFVTPGIGAYCLVASQPHEIVPMLIEALTNPRLRETSILQG